MYTGSVEAMPALARRRVLPEVAVFRYHGLP
jgi:hypothetical protein